MENKPSGLHLRIYHDHKKEWRFTFVAANGEPLAVSSEGYQNRNDALAAADLIMFNKGGLEISMNYKGKA